MECFRQEFSDLQLKAQGNTQENKKGVPGDTGISTYDAISMIGWNLTYFLSRSERDVNIILKPVLAKCLHRFEAHSLGSALKIQ